MKKIFRNILLAATLSSFTACTDLDIDPNSQLTDENAYQTEQEFLNGLSGVYSTMGVYTDQMFKVNETSSDEAVCPTRGADWGGDQLRNLHKHTWTADNLEINGAYEGISRSIAQANLFIETIDKSSFKSEFMDGVRAETRFVRAFMYFNLMDMYGNVPLVLNTLNPSNPPANNTRKEVFEWLVQEVTELSELLPTTNEYGRVDRSAANFLLGKLYLNAEVYVGQSMYTEALDALNNIIKDGNYHLANEYKSLFSWDNDNNKENIFVFRYDSNYGEWGAAYYIHMFTLHYSLKDKYSLADTPWNGFSTLGDFVRKYDDNDKRKEIFLVGQQYDNAGNMLYQRDGSTPLNFTLDYETSYGIDNATEAEGARVLKYVPGGDMPKLFLNNDFAVFRYADVLLMKAEAILRGGIDSMGATPLQLVNEVRARAFDNSSDATLSSIDLPTLLDERGREFAWEMWRRNDQIRFGTWDDAWEFKGASQSFRNLFPIPNIQLNANPNLTQNPGY